MYWSADSFFLRVCRQFFWVREARAPQYSQNLNLPEKLYSDSSESVAKDKYSSSTWSFLVPYKYGQHHKLTVMMIRNKTTRLTLFIRVCRKLNHMNTVRKSNSIWKLSVSSTRPTQQSDGKLINSFDIILTVFFFFDIFGSQWENVGKNQKLCI